MSFTFKQGPVSNPSMGGGTTATATITPTAGSLLVAAVQSVDSRTLNSVSDSTNGAWTSTGLTKQVSNTNNDLHPPFYFLNTASAALTVTFTLNATSTTLWVMLLEYAGIATSSAFDAGGGNADTGTGIQTLAVPSAAATMAAVPELWLGIGWASALANRDFAAVSGWTHDVDSTNASAGPYFSAFSKESASATSGQITLSTAPNNQFMAGFFLGFKESGGGGATVVSRRTLHGLGTRAGSRQGF